MCRWNSSKEEILKRCDVISALRRLKQEDCKFEARLGPIDSFRPV
jgi:hypothetical protein